MLKEDFVLVAETLSDNRIAELFLANGHVWLRSREKQIAVRLSDLSEDEANALKVQFRGGYVSRWLATGDWQWEAAGKRAMQFLLAVKDHLQLVPVRREPREPKSYITHANDGASH